MPETAYHVPTGQLIYGGRFKTSKDFKSAYPGEIRCRFCQEELTPVSAGFYTDENQNRMIYRKMHFRHKNNIDLCLTKHAESAEHAISVDYWYSNLQSSIAEHFKRYDCKLYYEPVIKANGNWRKPDVGIAYNGNLKGGCEAQLTRITNKEVFTRGNDHLRMGLTHSFWAFKTWEELPNGANLPIWSEAKQLEIAREYGAIFTFSPVYTIEVVPYITSTGLEAYTRESVISHTALQVSSFAFENERQFLRPPVDLSPDDYAQYIEAIIRGNPFFPCHTKYVELDETPAPTIVIPKGVSRKYDLTSLKDVLHRVTKDGLPVIEFLEVRTKDNALLGILHSVNLDGTVTVSNHNLSQVYSIDMVYISTNILDECIPPEDIEDKRAIADLLKEKTAPIKDAMKQGEEIFVVPDHNQDERTEEPVKSEDERQSPAQCVVDECVPVPRESLFVGREVKVGEEFGRVCAIRGYGSLAFVEIKLDKSSIIRVVPIACIKFAGNIVVAAA